MPDLDYGLTGASITSDDAGSLQTAEYAIRLSDILVPASKTLMDTDHVRFPLADLCEYVDAGLREIALHKPNEIQISAELVLIPGAHQTLSNDHAQALRFIRNLATLTTEGGPARVGAGAITTISRQVLDAFNPDWSDSDVVPRAAKVKHVIYDPASPRTYMVYPPNDGTGLIEADIVPILRDCELTDGETTAAGQAFRVNCPEIMTQTLVNYVIYRAYEIDDEVQSSAMKAMKHYQMFAQSLGLKLQGEALNPNSYRRDRKA
ncbi:DUF6682 family protein [uncultured Roseobacter sp.]|uniref:phage adaptor protein n=1 Tax=uncultured Roseobacter sp. TaxID=114847 RepID=UPI00261CBEF2|nr:DUF6682 family protein [uncultured Roseobacter sp.]